MQLTEFDYETVIETARRIHENPDAYDGPETVVLSTGYADIFFDGDVVQHGRVVCNAFQ